MDGPAPTTCSGGIAAAPDPRGPFEIFALSYLDETMSPYFAGFITSFQLPGQLPPYSADQAFRWSARLVGTAMTATGSNAVLEASVGYGQWPGVVGTIDGEYTMWVSLQDGDDLFISSPIRLQQPLRDLVDIKIELPVFSRRSQDSTIRRPYCSGQCQLTLMRQRT
jgi:hypothetical protein